MKVVIFAIVLLLFAKAAAAQVLSESDLRFPELSVEFRPTWSAASGGVTPSPGDEAYQRLAAQLESSIDRRGRPGWALPLAGAVIGATTATVLLIRHGNPESHIGPGSIIVAFATAGALIGGIVELVLRAPPPPAQPRSSPREPGSLEGTETYSGAMQ